ncbi:hypothetical protein EDB83DRAFT_708325 [Lactarius deliciosus]|nr:hypothetical protein EDB83DRAFT_708325 [Lactarius deliciosus]
MQALRAQFTLLPIFPLMCVIAMTSRTLLPPNASQRPRYPPSHTFFARRFPSSGPGGALTFAPKLPPSYNMKSSPPPAYPTTSLTRSSSRTPRPPPALLSHARPRRRTGYFLRPWQ